MKLLTLCAAISTLWIGLGADHVAAQTLKMQACQDAELGRSDCGVFLVPEQRLSRRTIALDVTILRATDVNPVRDPIVVLQGGPGQPATQQADFYARTFAPLREKRDIYLLDARGTGRSNSLHCSVGGTSPADFLPLAAVRSCRKKLSERADLSAYTTRQTVNDLELLRRRMRLRTVNLYGTSYGTRLALEYMRLHPGAVRTATLSGVVPAQNDAPTEYGQFAQAAFNRYVSLCSKTARCAAAYPDPRGDLAKAQIVIASAYKAGTTNVSPGLFGELVRMGLYSPSRVAPLFKGIQEASAGNLSHWEKAARGLSNFWSPEALSLGTFLSVTCADFAPRVDMGRARRLGAGTFAGSYRAEQQAAACEVWNVPPTRSNFSLPVRSSVPTLLLSGEYDPVTPPQWGELARKTLPNARHVVFQNSGHGLGPAASCAVTMMKTLIELRNSNKVDARCARELPLPPLRTEP